MKRSLSPDIAALLQGKPCILVEDPAIEKVAANIESLLTGGDTDVLPDLSGDVQTVVGVIDDR